MKREVVTIHFTDLRRLAREVPAYLTAQCGVNEAFPLTADVEDELGLAGLDTQELILGFASAYSVELANFDFTGYLSPEGLELLHVAFFIPLVAYLLLAWLLRTAAGAGGWLFSANLARRIWRQPIPRFWLPAAARTAPQTLTFGDFVASAAAGRFVTREQVRLQLLPAWHG